MTGTSGYFNDGSGCGHDYSSNLDCQWLISAPSNVTSIRIRFTKFHTENNYDFVRIVTGNLTFAAISVSFSGSDIPSETTITGVLLTVHAEFMI